MIGLTFRFRSMCPRPPQAFHAYNHAAALGSAEALLNLADMYAGGDGLPRGVAASARTAARFREAAALLLGEEE